MNTRSKIVAAALGLLVATGAAADASAATLATTPARTTRTVAMTRTMHPRTVKIAHRFHRPLRHVAGLRVLPGHRIAPRIHLAHAVTKKVVKTTIIR